MKKALINVLQVTQDEIEHRKVMSAAGIQGQIKKLWLSSKYFNGSKSALIQSVVTHFSMHEMGGGGIQLPL